jgi:hypothetical protein
MNQRLSTWLLFGAFLLWPLTACGHWCLGFRSGAEYSGKRK